MSLQNFKKWCKIDLIIDQCIFESEIDMRDIQSVLSKSKITVYRYGTKKFKTENVSIYFSLPSIQSESVKRSLLLSVLKRGTNKYPTQREINERLDDLYATLVNLKNQKFENKHLIGVSADIIKSSYTDGGEDLMVSALEVIKEILFCPRLDENGMFCSEFIESEKENYKSIILSQINEPRTFAAIRSREEMFASLGIIDKLDTMCQKIDAISASELYECYCEVIKNAQIKVFYVGERSADEIAELVSSAFEGRETVLAESTVHDHKLLEDLDEPQEIIEHFDISQGRLVMGFNCRTTWCDDDYYAMLLCNEILGAPPISKMMTNIREAMSLCYECSSVYNSARGVIFATVGIDFENYELAKNAIIEQIKAIQNGDISDIEFDSAKKSINNVYLAIQDSPAAIERFYLGRMINGIDVDVDEFIDRIARLEKTDVISAAKRLKLHTVYFLRDSGEGERYE